MFALAQCTSGPDPEANLALVTEWAERAAAAGARVVIFPEATMSWFAVNPRRAAEPVDGPWARQIAHCAARLGVTIVVGMFTRTPGDDRVRNTLLVTNGAEHTRYHKIHLFDAFGQTESTAVAPGEQGVTVELDGWQTGLGICYDIRFPELFKGYAADGAELLVIPASWGAGPMKVEMWRQLAITRALDTTCYVLACGQALPEAGPGAERGGGPPLGVGHSLVVDPLGQVVAEAGAAPELLTVSLDHDRVRQAREILPVLANSRLAIGRQAQELDRNH